MHTHGHVVSTTIGDVMGDMVKMGYCEEHDARWYSDGKTFDECFVCVWNERDRFEEALKEIRRQEHSPSFEIADLALTK